ncbi:hypothetical protein R6Q59_013967 [Mikania micrantha]
MACRTRFEIDTIVSSYDFGSLKGSLVDVGGGIHILKVLILIRLMWFHLHQHMKAGVTHVGSDMFTAIPHADSFLLKVFNVLLWHKRSRK